MKKFRLDESEQGIAVQEIITEVYKYWLRLSNCDGFRIDAAKHAGEKAVSRFCTNIREYAADLGKKEFFLFAEIPAADKFSFSFFKPCHSSHENKIYNGPDTILDFPLHFLIKKTILGKESVRKLQERYVSIENAFNALQKVPVPLVTFLDNHDQIESHYKKRIATDLSPSQFLTAIGLLLTLPGIPCIYYGTEQGFSGEGNTDASVREAMFDFEESNGADCFDEKSFFFREISRLISLRKECPELINGKIIWTEFETKNKGSLKREALFFFRELSGEQCLIGFNLSKNEKQEFLVRLKKGRDKEYSVRYSNLPGRSTDISMENGNGTVLKIALWPEEFIILK